MYGFLKKQQQRLSSLAYLMWPFSIQSCQKFFLILPASVSYISFVSFSEPLLFPLLYYSSLKLLAFA